MTNEFMYQWEDDDGDKHEVEVHFVYTRGSKGVYHKLPEDCYPAEGPEVSILYLVDDHGNELTEDEWPVNEETLVEAIIKFMEDHDGY